jgi:hypothetical protein|tara:strand:- start:121 stop:267 length:147 start_codon:yes stop_codon:yes gene_type:complete
MTVRAHIERVMFGVLDEYNVEPFLREQIFKTCYEYQHAINKEREMGVQ